MAEGRRDARWWAKALTPPIVVIAVKSAARRLGLIATPAPPDAQAPSATGDIPEWEHLPEGWRTDTTGWDDGTVADAYLAKWPEWVEALHGAAPLGINHEARANEPIGRDDLAAHNMLLSFAYVVARAAHDRTSLSVLDWGGGLGHYALVAQAALPGVELDWHCREVPSVARAGATDGTSRQCQSSSTPGRAACATSA